MPQSIEDHLEGFIHHAIQFIAMIGQAYVPPMEDDSHTNMCWHIDQKAYMGHRVEGPLPFRAAFYPEEMSLHLLDDEDVSSVIIRLSQLSPSEVLDSLRKRLTAIGYEGEKLQEIKHYEIPAEPLASIGHFVLPSPGATQQWALYRSEAQKGIEAIASAKGYQSMVQTWPHHFDAGIFEKFEIPEQEGGLGIGLGFAVKDTVAKEPYFYVYLWQEKGSIDYAQLPPLTFGHWADGDWKGAYLGVSEVFTRGGAVWQ
ncbi:MAG: hypothetical protein AAFP02_01325, partial [Bacteroidota bacterium]